MHSHNAAARLSDVADREFLGEISFPARLQWRSVSEHDAADLGTRLFLPVFWPRIFLSRLFAPQPQTVARNVFDLCNDRAVHHDPFPKADGRDVCGDLRGHFPRLAEL